MASVPSPKIDKTKKSGKSAEMSENSAKMSENSSNQVLLNKSSSIDLDPTDNTDSVKQGGSGAGPKNYTSANIQIVWGPMYSGKTCTNI